MTRRRVNFRTLDLNLLRVFDTVMVERHVTRAAERLAMTQPAVSNAMRRLRGAVGEELFVPVPGGVTPTPRAQALWPAVREALTSLQDAFDPGRFDVRTDRRSFTLAMADATAAVLVPMLADALLSEQAQVDLHVVGLHTRDPRPMIEQGAADVALGFFPDARAGLAAEGEQAVARLDSLYTCEYQCVMRRDHPLAAPGALTLDAYCRAIHVRVSFAGRPCGFVDEALVRMGRERRVMLTVNNFSTAGSVVHRSDLLTVLPRSFVPATGFEALLAMRPLPLDVPAIEVGLLWHRRHEHDEAQRWLRATLTRVAREFARRRT